MPLYRYRKVLGLARGAKAFMSLEAGVTRGTVPARFLTPDPENRGGGVRPENIIWVFGTGRTGSTWLAAMMEELEGHEVWFEPRIGACFDATEMEQHGGTNFFFARQYKDIWLRSVRNLILDSVGARFPGLGGGYLAIKEPGGSEGAPVLMEALPESRMVLLVRDPRDVAASWLDAARKGGWQNERRADGDQTAADRNPNAFVRRHARAYFRNVGNANRAYEAHEGRKVLVRYEDLRANALQEMRRLYSELEIPVRQSELERVVEKHAWEKIPEEEKGEGKFYRKATPQGWREDLTPHQADIVEEITSPLLDAFGYR